VPPIKGLAGATTDPAVTGSQVNNPERRSTRTLSQDLERNLVTQETNLKFKITSLSKG